MILDINRAEGFWICLFVMTWFMFLLGGFMIGETNRENTRRMPTWTRMTASCVLVIAGFIWVAFVDGRDVLAGLHPDFATSSGEMATLAFFMALGMLFGFFGDLFMAEIILKGDRHVVFGMLSFGVGHVLYIVGLVHFGEVTGTLDDTVLLTSIGGWWIIALVIWALVIYAPAKERSILHVLALPYALLLAGTTAVATALALEIIEFAPIALGALLFLISDLILATQLFNDVKFPKISDIVWFTYSPGQALIVLTIPMLAVLQGQLY